MSHIFIWCNWTERAIFAGDIFGDLKAIIKNVRFFSVALIYFILSLFRLKILITFSLAIKYDSLAQTVRLLERLTTLQKLFYISRVLNST